MTLPASTESTPVPSAVPNIAFLGLCERVSHHDGANGAALRHNVIGLKRVVNSAFYPVGLHWFKIAVAVYDNGALDGITLAFVSPDGKDLFTSQLNTHDNSAGVEDGSERENSEAPSIVAGQAEPQEMLVFVSEPKTPAWSVIFLDSADVRPIVFGPGFVRVEARRGTERWPLGGVIFSYTRPPPLTEERRRDIEAIAGAARRVAFEINCKLCGSKFKMYCGLSRDRKLEESGAVWYEELPDSFTCACGSTAVPLCFAREGLHALLQNPLASQEGEIDSLYNHEVLQRIHREFQMILAAKPAEEEVQKFLEKHPILFHTFAPIRVLVKPPVLTQYRADFGLLTPRRELILVEIERPDKKIMTKKGVYTSEFTQAIGQVTSWLQKVEEQRSGVLDALGLRAEDVVTIRGALVIGRDRDIERPWLRKLKWEDFGRHVSVFTYDDLLSALSALSRTIGSAK